MTSSETGGLFATVADREILLTQDEVLDSPATKKKTMTSYQEIYSDPSSERSLQELAETVDPSPVDHDLLIIYSETCMACNFLKKTFLDPDFKNILVRIFGEVKWVESGDIFTKENFVMFQETSSLDCTKLWNFSNISVPIIYMYKSNEGINADNLIPVDTRQFIGLFAVNPSESTLKKFLSGVIRESEKNA